MKKRLPAFLSGVLATTMVLSLGTAALAATGALTIEVNPINVQVNGQTFQPKDAQGNSVPVFAYNGTTYAPLRALAEAYGLEVGYDAGKNMATVGAKAADPATTPAPDTIVDNDYSDWSADEEKAYQEFKGMWEVVNTDKGDIKYDLGANVIGGPWELYSLEPVYELKMQELKDVFYAAKEAGFTIRLAKELGSSGVTIEICFCGKSPNGLSGFGIYVGTEIVD